MSKENKTLDKQQDGNDFLADVSCSSGLTRLDLGEAWMWCIDCNAKLYSFDGHKDATTKCPTKQDCEDERNSYYS